jgi:hypothetical protein
MLPDGAEKQLEDWTIFFLNQTPFNAISPVLALEKPEPNGTDPNGEGGSELLYVLNLVRTKHDKAVRRCVANLHLHLGFLSFDSLRYTQRSRSEGNGDLHPASFYSDLQSGYCFAIPSCWTNV